MEAQRGGVLLVIFLHLLITQFNKICIEGIHIPWALFWALGIHSGQKQPGCGPLVLCGCGWGVWH